MPQHEEVLPLEAELEADGLTLEQLLSICRVERDWLLSHIDEGYLQPTTAESGEQRFSATVVTRIRHIVVLERNFDAAPELAALVADLQEEIACLRRRLRVLGVE